MSDGNASWSIEQKELGDRHFMHTVVFVARDSQNDQVRPLGSGVFVAAGLVLTAKHVYQEAWASLTQNANRRFDSIAPFHIDAYHWPNETDGLAIWGVDAAWDTPFSDLALLRVIPSNDVAKRNHPGTVAVMNVYPPSLGDTIVAAGFPKTLERHDRKRIELGLHPFVTSGIVRQNYEAYRDRGLLNFPCFEVNAHVFPGMSGGPIYNQAGQLCGIICASFEGHPSFYGLSLWPALFIQLTRDEHHGRLDRAPYFGELGRGVIPIENLEEAIGRHYLIVDPDTGIRRLLLRSIEAYRNNWPVPTEAITPGSSVYDGVPPSGYHEGE
jgi:S1-C subfamily serine protease